MKYEDDDLLRYVRTERMASIGWGEGDQGTLRDKRERALEYHRGVMDDLPTLEDRSKAVSTDVAEAVETALPDLMEIFIGGDDVATFQPSSAEDEEKAQQESDYVKYVIFQENPGAMVFYTTLKDALLSGLGLFHWYWDKEEVEENLAEVPTESAAQVVMVAQAQGMELEAEDNGQGVSVLKRKRLRGSVKIISIPPEDFTVAKDTVYLPDATYCCYRARPRIQDLIADGVDPKVARSLKPYVTPDEQIALARDMGGENTQDVLDSMDDLQQVEVRYHYIRLLGEDGSLCLHKITTDSEEKVLIDKEEIEGRLPFGAITPYLNPHRFYGESVADKLMEIQRIKTSLLRMFLDSGYFALNQRMEVAMDLANEYTISDLLNNVPNMPVRVKQAGVVRPITAGGLSFDALAALEHVSVMGEQRTGIVRNAQGLNPDTLHDTAQGAMQLIAAAQKRVRLIARIMAETGIKDLYLGVHEMLRQGYSNPDEGAEFEAPNVKLGRQWQTVEPQTWGERKVLDVQVGVGSAGREHDLMVMGGIMNLQEKAVMSGIPGLVKPDNLYNSAIRYAQLGNIKNPRAFFNDPAEEPPPEPRPDPEMEKAKAQMMLEQEKAKANLQLKAQEGEVNAGLQQRKGEQDFELARMKLEMEMGLKREQIAAELQLKREQLAAEIELKRELGMAQAMVAHETGMAKVQASAATSEVNPGGEPG